MSAHVRAAIDAKVLAWIAEGATAKDDEPRFEALALELFRHQHAANPAYRRVCDAFEVDAARIRRWQDVPAVPTGAFKEARLACFPADRTVREFHSSGTTTQRPGTLALDTLALYEASLLATFRAYLCPDAARIRVFVLAPPARDAVNSSLSYMFDHAVERLGAPGSDWYVRASGWEPNRLIADLATAREPVAVVGTSFAFVHLTDALAKADRSLALPPGSRAMETGGFKGRSRALSRAELHDAIAARLGISVERIVNQYGMCELASQFYEPSLVLGHASSAKRVPPWVRTRVVDPETLADVPVGTRGMLVHYDLANTGSVLAVQTSDEGRLVPGGFEVFGRLAGAEARGCSIAADALLERG